MRPECAAACERYRLVALRSPLTGRAGERLGRGTGSSIEFMDFRDYVPGDDPRHVDWRAFARTDQLKVRLYREEVAPVLDLVADLSPSMGVTPAKERTLRDLVESVARWSVRAGGRPRRLAAGGRAFADGDTVPLAAGGTAAGGAALLPLEALVPRSLRFLVSDFLFAPDPGPELRRLAAGAAHVFVVQLLDPWELDPRADGPLTLVDCESGERLDVQLADRALRQYHERLGRLRGSVERAVRAAGGTFATLVAAAPEAMCASLMAQGIVEPSP